MISVAMKDSGIPWLGKVPVNWTITKIKHVTSKIGSGKTPKGGSEVYTDNGVIFIRSQNVHFDGLRLDDVVYITEETNAEMESTEIQQDDVLLNITGASIGRCSLVPQGFPKANVNQHVCILRPITRRIIPGLLNYIVSSYPVQAQIDVVNQGISREGLNFQQAGNIVFAYPEGIEDQEEIFDFVRAKAQKIDSLIAKLHTEIEIIQEYRRALITQSVTKGLEPSVPMKDAGIPWLREIPVHWRIVRNKSLFYEFTERNEADDGELLTVSHITGVTKRSEKNVNMFLAESLIGYKKCVPGDLVINTMWAWMGALGISSHEGVISPSYNTYRLRRDADLHPRYYDYLCRLPDYVAMLKAFSTGVWESRLRLYPNVFLSLMTCLPPVSEQRMIAEYLDRQIDKLDKLISLKEQSIGLYEEYRQALISAAVTGQIDVKEYKRDTGVMSS